MSQFSKRHFQDIDIKELIYQYKQYDCLWDFNCENYKNKGMKQEAWQDIANYFQKDVSEVKRKIKYLRSAYVNERGKVVSSQKRKSEPPYKPSLFYYNQLSFLDDIVVLRKFGNDNLASDIEFENVNFSQNTEDNEEFIPVESEEDIDKKKSHISCKIETFTENELQIPLSPKMKSTPQVVSARSLPPRSVKRKINGQIKINQSAITNASENDQKDPYENLYVSFGKTIALQLQQLPLEMAILAMSEIQAILTKKILDNIKSLPNTQQAHSESDDDYSELIEEGYNDSS